MSWILFPFNLFHFGLGASLGLLLVGPWCLVLLPPVVVRLRPGRALGMALPGLVLVARWDDHILRHEFAHIRQMRRWSPLGTALFLGWHYGRALAGGRSFLEAYYSNPLEIGAEWEAHQTRCLLWHFRLPPAWYRRLREWLGRRSGR